MVKALRCLLVCASLGIALLAFAAAPAAAQGNLTCTPIPNGGGSSTCTANLQGFVQTFPSIGMACVPDGIVTVTENTIVHMTVNTAHDAWGTTTAAGDFTLVPGTFTFNQDGSIASFTQTGPAFTGHFAFWFGFSANNLNFVVHDVFNAQGTAPDGSSITAHMVFHFSVSAVPSGGNVNQFFIVSC